MKEVMVAIMLLGAGFSHSILAKSSSPLAIIQLQRQPGANTTVEVKVGDHTGVFLFDTGEGVTTITPDFAATVGCKPWGRITGFRMSGERLDTPRCDNLVFELGGHRFRAPIVGVFDIMRLLPESPVRLSGAIGLDIFVGNAITLQSLNNRLIIESRTSLAARTAKAKEVSIRLVRDAEGVALAVDTAVPTPQGTAWMELDSGNGGTLVIAKHLASLFGLDPERKEPQPIKFKIAGVIPVEGLARTPDIIMDGNIGLQFLRHWDLMLDLANARAWLAPAKPINTHLSRHSFSEGGTLIDQLFISNHLGLR